MDQVWLFLVYVLGVMARVVVPYIQARLLADGPLTFDWRFVVGQLLGAITGVLVLFLMGDFWTLISKAISEFSQIGPYAIYLAVFCIGWFATDAGRMVDKQVAK